MSLLWIIRDSKTGYPGTSPERPDIPKSKTLKYLIWSNSNRFCLKKRKKDPIRIKKTTKKQEFWGLPDTSFIIRGLLAFR